MVWVEVAPVARSPAARCPRAEGAAARVEEEERAAPWRARAHGTALARFGLGDPGVPYQE